MVFPVRKIDRLSFFLFQRNASAQISIDACKEFWSGRNLLFLACRHHIYEVYLKTAFESICGDNTSGPDVPEFTCFRNSWNSINVENYKSGISETYIKNRIDVQKLRNILNFVRDQLEVKIFLY